MNDTLIKELTEKFSESKNVGIFIDFDNIYYSLKDYGINVEISEYDIFKAISLIYPKEKVRTLRAYADYDQVKVSFKWMQEHRVQIKNVYGNGLEEDRRKNASDIELSIDAMEAYYKNTNIDTFVFITSDSDMIPIMSRLMYKGKTVHLYYIDEHTSQHQNLLESCNEKVDILDLLAINKSSNQLDYWNENAVNEINNWYTENSKGNKTLGGKWINKLFCDKFYFTKSKSSELISHLLEVDKIELIEDNGKKYYKVKEHTEEDTKEDTEEAQKSN